MAFVANAGINLHYERSGTGPAVLLLHTWLTTSLFWKEQVGALRRDYQVLTLDFRGHGDSSKPRGAYTTSILTRDVRRVIEAVGVKEFAVVGWGLGGVVALSLLKQVPAQVKGIVLIGTNPKTLADPSYEHGLSQEESHQLVRELDRDYRRFLRGYAKRLFIPEAKQSLIAWANAEAAKTPPHAARALAEAVLECDESESLREINCPVLLCQGERDQITPPAAASFMASLVSTASLEAFANSGHAPHVEEAKKFNERVASFLGSLH